VWRCLYELFVPHLSPKRRYTFYLATIGGLVTFSAVKKEEESRVKHPLKSLLYISCASASTTVSSKLDDIELWLILNANGKSRFLTQNLLLDSRPKAQICYCGHVAGQLSLHPITNDVLHSSLRPAVSLCETDNMTLLVVMRRREGHLKVIVRIGRADSLHTERPCLISRFVIT